jgi:signal recognition particle subunit SRP54
MIPGMKFVKNMFEKLTDRLSSVFDNLRRRGRLTPADVDMVLRDVRMALLEADVHLAVTNSLVDRIRNRAVGHEVSRALNPAQQVIKIVNEELIGILGEPAKLNLSGPKPRSILLAGLQGVGKTTAAGKLAKKLREQGERVLLVAGDPYRPAAVDQIQALGKQIGVEVFSEEGVSPPKLAKKAHKKAQNGGYTVMIMDTAGRSQLDDQLMDELEKINKQIQPNEVILVVDSMIGQESVNIAQSFRKVVPLTGLLLTKLDGDSRGGAAISIREVTGIPIKYLSTGEDLDSLETYDPKRLASRILGMGDMIGLIEKAEEKLDAEESVKSAKKMMSGEFSLEDFADQIRQIKKLGPLGQLMGMMPGGGAGAAMAQVDPNEAEKGLKQVEAIINSMTIKERQKPKKIDASRKRRIAAGSGTDVQAVNRLLKQFKDMQRLMKRMKKTGMRGFPGMPG